jgi:spermidine synthase
MRSRAAGRRRPASGGHVVVRDGPRGRELLVDGTFASFYRPGQVTTGSVWDAIAVPVLALPPARRRRVLLLGLGAGSAARIVRALAPEARIVGIERDRAVVLAARRFFDLDTLGIEVVMADAREFLLREKGRFDAVIDDVFVGSASRVRKPDWLPEPGLRLAARRVARGGILISNTIDEAPAAKRALAALYGAGVCIGIDGYHNRVVTAGAAIGTGRALRAAVAQSALLRTTLPKLRFRAF